MAEEKELTAENELSEETGKRHWLDHPAIRIYPAILLCVYLGLATYWVAKGEGYLDVYGKAYGYDFLAFWTAGTLALEGQPEIAYDQEAMFAAERRLLPGQDQQFPWFYPPTYLLLMAPLALLPYLAAYFFWQTLTLAGLGILLRQILPHPMTLWFFLGTPLSFWVFASGQNGFLTAGLFAAGIYWLARRPTVSGIAFGLLTIKPHLGLLIPLALLCGHHWKAFAAATVTAIGLALVSLAVFGLAPWAGFLEAIGQASSAMEGGKAPLQRMVSFFAALKRHGASLELAQALHFALAALVALLVARTWWRGNTPAPLAAAVLAAGTALISPFLYDYDLMIQAVAIALLVGDGLKHGWMRGEREFYAVMWFWPIIAIALWVTYGLPLGLLGSLLLFGQALRRIAWHRARAIAFER